MRTLLNQEWGGWPGHLQPYFQCTAGISSKINFDRRHFVPEDPTGISAITLYMFSAKSHTYNIIRRLMGKVESRQLPLQRYDQSTTEAITRARTTEAGSSVRCGTRPERAKNRAGRCRGSAGRSAALSPAGRRPWAQGFAHFPQHFIKIFQNSEILRKSCHEPLCLPPWFSTGTRF